MSTEYLNPTKKIRMIAIFYLFFSLYYGNNNSTHHFSVILEFWDVNTFVFKRTSGTGYMLYNYHLFSTFLLFSFSSIPLLCLPLLLPCCNLLFFFCPFPFHGQSWWFILNYQPKQNKTKNPKTTKKINYQDFPSSQVEYWEIVF